MGATILVNRYKDEDSVKGYSLRNAIKKAVDGDTIEFDSCLNGLTLTLKEGQLLIDKNLTIKGPGANLLTVSGNDLSRVFRIGSAATVKISGLKITKGRAPTKDNPDKNIPDDFHYLGGGILNLGTLTLEDILLSYNRAEGQANDTFKLNGWTGRGGAGGGGIANLGTLTVCEGSKFVGNQALGTSGSSDKGDVGNTYPGFAYGGGLANVPWDPAQTGGITATAIVKNCQFTGNRARGGDKCIGIYAVKPNDPTKTKTNANIAGDASGGAIASFAFTKNKDPKNTAKNSATLKVSGSQFGGNQAMGGNDNQSPILPGHAIGGAIASQNFGGNADVRVDSNCTFDANQAIGGDRNVVTDGGNDALRAVHNMAGGGALFANGTGNISGSHFSNNQAIGGKGVDPGTLPSLPGTTFEPITKNGGDARGGGIAVAFTGTDVEVYSCTIESNSAIAGKPAPGGLGGNAWGGGVAIPAQGQNPPYAILTIVNSKIINNIAKGGVDKDGWGKGGGVYIEGLFMKGTNNISNNSASTSNPNIYSEKLKPGPIVIPPPPGSGKGNDGLGGGVFCRWGSTLNLEISTISQNMATGEYEPPTDWIKVIDFREIVLYPLPDIWEPEWKLSRWQSQLDKVMTVLGQLGLDLEQEHATEYLDAARREFGVIADLVLAARSKSPEEQAILVQEIATQFEIARASLDQLVQAAGLGAGLPTWDSSKSAEVVATAVE